MSAYESGARQPSIPTLERLIAATGFELDLQVRSGQPSIVEPVSDRLRSCRDRVLEITGAHGLSNVRVFGSVVRGNDHPGSDIDLLVDVPPSVGLLALGRCQAELEALLETEVDLVPASDLKESVAAEVVADAQPL